MKMPDCRTIGGKWRTRLFLAWIVGSIVIAVYTAIAGPFASYFGAGRPWVAIAVPAAMIFLLATGLGWLVLFVVSRPRRNRT